MYQIYQVSGKFEDAAREYEQLRIRGELEAAKKLFRNITGMQGAIDGSTWWTYNASGVIAGVNRHQISYKDLLTVNPRIREDEFGISERWARTLCTAATKRFGGVWKYFYEY